MTPKPVERKNKKGYIHDGSETGSHAGIRRRRITIRKESDERSFCKRKAFLTVVRGVFS